MAATCPMTSSMVSSMSSCFISIMSPSFSNCIITRCMAGRFTCLFIAYMARAAPFIASAMAAVLLIVWIRIDTACSWA